MQAIQINASRSFSLAELPVPLDSLTEPHDILVRVRGIALNPGETKIFQSAPAGTILGFDASGVVEAVGPQAEALGFKKGDAVFSGGAIGRAGSNAQYQLVDARLAGKKPESLSWEEAAALPLVGLTAWEMFEEKFRLKPFTDNSSEVLLIVNGAGGVGTLAIALAKAVFGITRIITTASRPETIEWVKKYGATDVLNHREPLGPQLEALGVSSKVTLAFITHDTPHYTKELLAHMRYQGQIGCIVETGNEIVPLHDPIAFYKSLSFHWELEAGKALYGYDLESQGRILTHISRLADEGKLGGSPVTVRKELSVANLTEMHKLQASGKSYGKIVFTVPDNIQ